MIKLFSHFLLLDIGITHIAHTFILFPDLQQVFWILEMHVNNIRLRSALWGERHLQSSAYTTSFNPPSCDTSPHCHLVYYYLGFCLQINNPDMRVQILKEYVKENFPATPLLDYALEVEKITTSKVTCHSLLFNISSVLIPNTISCPGCIFWVNDLHSWYFIIHILSKDHFIMFAVDQEAWNIVLVWI